MMNFLSMLPVLARRSRKNETAMMPRNIGMTTTHAALNISAYQSLSSPARPDSGPVGAPVSLVTALARLPDSVALSTPS